MKHKKQTNLKSRRRKQKAEIHLNLSNNMQQSRETNQLIKGGNSPMGLPLPLGRPSRIEQHTSLQTSHLA